MPDFDYEEFDRRQAEWEAQNRDMEEDEDRGADEFDPNSGKKETKDKDSDEDVSW